MLDLCLSAGTSVTRDHMPPVASSLREEISGIGTRAEHSGHPQPGNPINHTMLKARQETWARCQTTSGKAASSTFAFCLMADWGEKVQNVCPVLCLSPFQCLVKITARENAVHSALCLSAGTLERWLLLKRKEMHVHPGS